MDRRNKKGVFILIVGLLISFSLLSIAGLSLKFMGYGNNQGKEQTFYKDGKLHFYKDGKLIGTYTCKNETNYCDFAYEMIDEIDYNINFYDDQKIDKIGLINDRYVFLIDDFIQSDDEYYRDSSVILYDVVGDYKIREYRAVKNYTLGLENDKFIVQHDDGKWGVITLTSDFLINILGFDYDYIGLVNRKNSDKQLIADNYIVKTDNSWSIINEKTVELVKNIIFPIVDYNGKYVITHVGDNYYLHDYDGNMQLSAETFLNLSFTGKYVSVLESNRYFYVYDPETNTELTPKLYVLEDKNYVALINKEGKIEITIGDEVTTYGIG